MKGDSKSIEARCYETYLTHNQSQESDHRRPQHGQWAGNTAIAIDSRESPLRTTANAFCISFIFMMNILRRFLCSPFSFHKKCMQSVWYNVVSVEGHSI